MMLSILLMILTIAKILAGSSREQYHIKGPDEYYTKELSEGQKKESIGYFLGEAAKKFGLYELPIYVNDVRVKAILEGKHPVTHDMMRRREVKSRTYINKKTGRTKLYKTVSGSDFTISLDKSVSILWALGLPPTRAWILNCFQISLKEWFKGVEKEIAFTRTGAGGGTRERAAIFSFVFIHFTSRAMEPQLHAHVVVPSLCIRRDGRGGALDLRPVFTKEFIYRQGQKFRDIFRTHLEHDLKKYGVQLKDIPLKHGTSFRIDEIPDSLCQALSSRSADIQKRLKDIPEPKASDVQKAVLAGRPPKNEAISQERLFVVWQNVAKAHGFDTERFLRESRDRSLMAEQIRSQTNASFSSGVEAEPKSHREPEHKGTQEQTTHRAIAQQKHPPRLAIAPFTLSPRSLPAPERQERRLRTLIRSIRDRLSPEWLRSTEAFDKELKRARELSAQRREAFLGKITLLYAIGKVSCSTYLRHKEGRGLPRTKLGIELRYWSGQGSLAERIYLRIKGGHGMPEFGVPKSRFGINLAAATGQISRMQQLLLLKQNGHIKKHQHSHRY